MANPWFRMYYEFADDPKVQMMTEAMQRRLIMLFCSKCKGETLHETELAFHWRISETELAETKAVFLQKGFIDEGWNLLNWNKRQFLSDSSTDRVRRFRSGKKQDETLHETPEKDAKRKKAVTVTPPDTDTDTDTEKKNTLASTAVAVPAAKLVCTIPLNDGTEHQVFETDVQTWQALYPAVDVRQELRSIKGWALSNPTRRKTKSGVAKFINSWLSRAQNEAGKKATARFEPGVRVMEDTQHDRQATLDYWRKMRDQKQAIYRDAPAWVKEELEAA